MAFRSIQQVLAFFASDLRERCRAVDSAGVGAWRFEAELADQQRPLTELQQDVPLVVLQSGAGSRTLSNSLHPCFTYQAELVLAAQPDSAAAGTEKLLPALGVLEGELRQLLRAHTGTALVDPADDVAAAFLVHAAVEKASTESDSGTFIFKIPCSLVIQF